MIGCVVEWSFSVGTDRLCLVRNLRPFVFGNSEFDLFLEVTSSVVSGGVISVVEGAVFDVSVVQQP